MAWVEHELQISVKRYAISGSGPNLLLLLGGGGGGRACILGFG